MYGLNEGFCKKESHVRAISAHPDPGGSDTNLGNHLNLRMFWNTLMKCLGPMMMQSSEDGALGLLKGMVDPSAESGVRYYGPENSGAKGIRHAFTQSAKVLRKQSSGNYVAVDREQQGGGLLS